MSNVVPITVHPTARRRAKALDDLIAEVEVLLVRGAKEFAPLVRRINRAFKANEVMMLVRRTRPHLRSTLGQYYLLDVRLNDVRAINVNLMDLADDLGVAL